MEEILINFVLSLLGMLLHTLWKVREHLKDFSFRILWEENKFVFMWGTTFMLIASAILALSPESAEALTTITGLDFSKTASYVMLGIALISTTKEAIRENQMKKQIKTIDK